MHFLLDAIARLFVAIFLSVMECLFVPVLALLLLAVLGVFLGLPTQLLCWLTKRVFEKWHGHPARESHGRLAPGKATNQQGQARSAAARRGWPCDPWARCPCHDKPASQTPSKRVFEKWHGHPARESHGRLAPGKAMNQQGQDGPATHGQDAHATTNRLLKHPLRRCFESLKEDLSLVR